MENNWRYKSIENLEKKNYGDPKRAPTPLVERCLKLCKVPLDQFSVSDLRIMIGQSFALQYLVPLAIEHLEKDIFLDADFYPGDLLKNVLSIEPDFWKTNKLQWQQVNDLIRDHRPDLLSSKISTDLFDSEQ